ncbi:MAG: PLP-dependent aminotransferase family protein, partial [Nonomuraea sp.]|nr:PLP-dependent aminotransferase family protein [Nonomuraea sp.]
MGHVDDQLVVMLRDRLRLREGRESPSRRLAGALSDLAQTGALSGRLPSERELAGVVGLSRGTVAAAFNLLCEEGLAERRHGSGTYVRSYPAAPGFSGLLTGGPVLADLSASVVPDPSHLVMPALDPEELLRTPSGHGYDPLGHPALRAVLGPVLVTGGAQQGLDLAVRAFVRAGDRVLVGDPAYGGLLSILRRAGAHAVPVDLTSPAAVEAAIAAHRPALVYVAAVDNPTGAVQDLEHVAAAADAADVLLVEDRTLAPITYGRPSPEPLARRHPHGTVSVGSLSKVMWGGLRVGWLEAAEPLLARLVEAKLDADLATGAVSQRLAAALLELNPLTTWLDTLTARRAHFTGLLSEHLPGWRFTMPAGGLSVWARLPGVDTDRFAARAREEGVAVAPGSLFSPDGRHRDRLRLSFALPLPLQTEAVRL